jgi:hypothetical protein
MLGQGKELNMQRAMLNRPTMRVADTMEVSGRVTADSIKHELYAKKQSSLWRLTIFGFCKVCSLVAATLILPSLAYAQNNQGDNNQGDDLFSNNGGSYLITVTDPSTGAFVARAVLTFHADHTVSAILTGQVQFAPGAVQPALPTLIFSSQLGSWKFGNAGGLVARTLFFDFTNVIIDRLDYTATFASNRTQVTGTITITDFKGFQADPLGEGGFPFGNFNFTGTLVTP